MDGGTTAVAGLSGILSMVTQVLTSVISWIGQLVGMVLAEGHEILLLPLLLTFIAFAIGVFFHFVRS